MKIATWNLERLKHLRKLDEIIACCNTVDADILVLTEYDDRVVLNYPFEASTLLLHALDASFYNRFERRVKIYSKYPIIRVHETYDPYTTCCAEITTTNGPLLVYGTILGIYGNRSENFKSDFPRQVEDLKRLSALGPVCYAGDLNMTFSDNYYFTKAGRNDLEQAFTALDMVNVTRDLREAIDHIVVSRSYLGDAAFSLLEWNVDKGLSDHKGVSLSLNLK